MGTACADTQVIEWGCASTPLVDDISGDCHIVVPKLSGAVVAVIDGLGHGLEAAIAARGAAEIIKSHPEEPVLDLIQLCHEGLRRTRGAVMSIASLDVKAASMTWAGVGNVESMLYSSSWLGSGETRSVPARGGVVGYRLPSLRAEKIAITPGDLLVMATDGIRSAFASHIPFHLGVQECADCILKEFAKDSDDALVLVARYLGEAS